MACCSSYANWKKAFILARGPCFRRQCQLTPHAEVPTAILDSYSRQAGRQYTIGTPATLSPALQPLLARVRKREADRLVAAEMPLAKRRISVKSTPGALCASRNSLLLTTPS